MDTRSPVAQVCVCVCVCESERNMLVRFTNLSILMQNLQCIWTLNSLLTVGGTLFLAMHRYLPMSVRCTLLSSSVSPLIMADSKVYEYNNSTTILLAMIIYCCKFLKYSSQHNITCGQVAGGIKLFKSLEVDTIFKNILQNLKAMKCLNKY